MARYTGPVCKLCRRERIKLFLKGERCNTGKCSITRRKNAPGAKAVPMRKKQSNYGIQLREKQKLKRIYGVLEKQFKIYFMKAEKQKGITGNNLLIFLERRLDNIVYHLNWAASRSQARQLVKHGLLIVNNKRVNIPSFLAKSGDEIKIKENSNIDKLVKDSVKSRGQKSIPSWLVVDNKRISAKVLRFPEREDISIPINEQLVVELYSR
ncbi:MAG: 30S ribosomal protein S4 [bacterium]|nr:30S ribosomal protein S4 [bacterium]